MPRHDHLPEGVHRFTWPNGLRLIAEPVPGVRTVAIGLWFDTGSRHEPPERQGVAHFLEHMFFKGTETMDAQALALAQSALGGHFNAFTTQETVCLHARVIDEHLERALRLLVEMFRRSALDEQEIERERSVILEEIKLTSDNPEDWIHDLFHESLWPDHSLGRSILGTPETIGQVTRAALVDHLSAHFTAPRLVVAAAGAIDPERLADLTGALLGDLPAPASQPPNGAPPTARFTSHHVARPFEQVHFCLGTLAPTRTAEVRHAFALLNAVLGGGPSSRIFQEIRERRGLAYSIGTFSSPYRDTGCFGISGGTSPENLDKVLDLSRAEVERICREPVPADEVQTAKDQIRSHLLLGLESMNHRMSRLAEIEIYFDRFIPLEETLRTVAALTPDDLLSAAQQCLAGVPMAIVTLGTPPRA